MLNVNNYRPNKGGILLVNKGSKDSDGNLDMQVLVCIYLNTLVILWPIFINYYIFLSIIVCLPKKEAIEDGIGVGPWKSHLIDAPIAVIKSTLVWVWYPKETLKLT